jgi:hypothetical protein
MTLKTVMLPASEIPRQWYNISGRYQDESRLWGLTEIL